MSIYWHSTGIPILNSSADLLNPLCRVLPIRQDFTYCFCFTGAETEIHKIKDDSKMNREKNIDRRCQRHIVNVWHLSDPPSFSSPTTFKVNLKAKIYICVNSTTQRCPNKITKIFLFEDFFHLPPVFVDTGCAP